MGEIQVIVLRALLSKAKFETLSRSVTSTLMSGETQRKMLNLIFEVHKSSEGDIETPVLEGLIRTQYHTNPTIEADMLDVLERMKEAPEVPSDQVGVMVREWRVREHVHSGIQYGSVHMDDPDLDLDKLAGFFDRAREAAINVDATVADYFTMEPPSVNVRKGVTPLGLSAKMDADLSGGAGNGELVTIMGPGGRGKTSFMIAAGGNAAMLGRNPLFVTLEINAGKYGLTLDRFATKMTKEELFTAPVMAMKKRKEFTGKIWIKDWSHTKVGVAEIAELVHHMRREDKPVDYLVVDYWELLQATGNHKDPRFGFKQIGEDLRRLGNEFNLPVITGWQANRAGERVHSLTEEHIGEDYSIKKTSDIVITLNQSPEEFRNNRMRLGIMKQREDTKKYTEYPIISQLNRMIIRDETEQDIIDGLNMVVQEVGNDDQAVG